jgi:hypothetical protein
MSVVVGCVADNTPKYLEQAERLLKSWRWFGGRYADADFHVCVAGGVAPDMARRYEADGARVHDVAPFSARHPPSNKLRFLELEVTRTADRVLLLDCDVIVVQEPRQLFEGEDLIAKIADAASVPASVFERVFEAFGIELPSANCRCTVTGDPIIPYFNAGVLSFSRAAMAALVPRWLALNAQLVERLDLLDIYANFCEQTSLSLAVAATGTRYTLLDNRANFPAHFRDRPIDSEFGQTDPALIHYHWLTDEAGRILSCPYPKVDHRITAFNERYVSARRV